MDSYINMNSYVNMDQNYYTPKSYKKSDEKAVEFRNSGNNKYKNRKFILALIDYNKSIAFGKSKEVIALAYGNRSAVYFEFKLYEDCLKNIKWAFKNNFPKEKTANLIERKAKCEKLMQFSVNRENLWDFFKLSYPSNEKIPWLADCVTIRPKSKNEQGIFATRDLKAGDIISTEEMTIPYLIGDSFYGRCCNCLKPAFMNLIPCDKSATMMFCSTNCKNEFYAKAVDLSTIFRPDNRIYSEFVYLAGGKKKLKELAENADWNDLAAKKTVFDFDWNDANDPNYKKNILKCCLSFQTENFLNTLPPMIDLNQEILAKEFGGSAKVFASVASFMHNNLMYFQYLDDNLKEIFTYSSYSLFGNLITQSCSGNVVNIVADNKIISFLIRPVKKDEQLFLVDELIMNNHQETNECQMCKSLYNANIDLTATQLLQNKDYDGLKQWIAKTLKRINESEVKENHWDYYPTNYKMILTKLADLTGFP